MTFATLPFMFRHSLWRRRWQELAIPCLVLLCALSLQAQLPSTPPQGYVNDFAAVIDPQSSQRLAALAQELDQKARVQMAIVTVRSLEGRSIEEFSIELATRWGVGHKDRPGDSQANGGIMVLLAVDDRRNRIEVGYGLESIITDGRAGEILRSMVPQLRAADYGGALWLAASSIAQLIAAERGISLSTLTNAPQRRSTDGAPAELPLAFFFVPLIFLVIFALASRRRFKRHFGRNYRGWGGPWVGPWGGGGFGGWSAGGGGGGFGGFGGGSFGGGGASGRW